jgi:hypothetical protein
MDRALRHTVARHGRKDGMTSDIISAIGRATTPLDLEHVEQVNLCIACVAIDPHWPSRDKQVFLWWRRICQDWQLDKVVRDAARISMCTVALHPLGPLATI